MHAPRPRAVDAGLQPTIAPRVFVADATETPDALIGRIRQDLQDADETGLLMILYGRCGALRSLVLPGDLPVLALEGRPCHSGPMAGAFVYACPSSVEVRRFRSEGRTHAVVVEDTEARYCLFGGLGDLNPKSSRSAQTEHVLARLDHVLTRGGLVMADLVRTWFYNEDILDWYGDFNRVRTGYYQRRAFRTGAPPASTGVGGRYPDGVALGLAGWAMRPLDERAKALEVASPLQCPAPRYGSTFSRAVEIQGGASRRLFVSGTASIALTGESIHVGDMEKQITRTMEVIGAMLAARDFGWRDVDRATAYFKRAADLPYWTDWLERHGLEFLPCVAVEGTVCRDDLLFELEVDTCAPTAAL